MLSLFDLHCDTAKEIYTSKQSLSNNSLAVSLKNARIFKRYSQVMAHFTDPALSDEQGWQTCLAMLEYLSNDPAILNGNAHLQIGSFSVDEDRFPALWLSVEDARILANRPERVDQLFRLGFRILTPLWSGCTCIGGAHDTQRGLTEFGKQALQRAVRLGMILDISHASDQSADEMLLIAKDANRPIIASHSNVFYVCPVSRNLKDEQIQAIVRSDGLIGINLHTYFLKSGGNATASDVLRHIDALLERGADKAICLGCDMDGANLPPDIANINALPKLAELMLAQNYSEKAVNALFYENATRFFQTYL